ncbi:DUF4251 domain-containing protein [Parabacteroides sp. 52]|uniref:DUF4251 domain-containing protein n=1 Tax=unclassified Parabacteroides TaxID=2649774 RepID=UPI0013D581BC|nr:MULTISPECIES: DUF4251 domain-containing protein [unclassified Parabacteroides]MDH6535335.1 hypothetical protein [Parabacteroides sp. PM5-20]NDV55873.1 DUF4251 domain-containing protein [Parabacteroides sp. 52]
MKQFKPLFVCSLVLLAGGFLQVFAQNKKEQKEKEVKVLLQNGSYKIDVHRALPRSGRAINLTSLYTLEIRGDSVFSHLPYFGRAYSVPYGGGDGLHFAEAMEEELISQDKKGNTEIKFQTRTSEDLYQFNIKVFNNGSVSIYVSPTNRQSISFQGELRTKENTPKED